MRRKKRLLGQLFVFHLIITLSSMVAVTWYASYSFREFYLMDTAKILEAKAWLFEKQLRQFTWENIQEIDSLCKEFGKKTATRITVIHSSGKVLGDSEEDPVKMDNHAHRQEVIEASNKGIGEAMRYSKTLMGNMMYVALPVVKDGKLVGFVRTAISMRSIDHALHNIHIKFILGGLCIAFFAGLVGLLFLRRIRMLLDEMRQGSERFARGELSLRLKVPDAEEFAGLTIAMNQMAGQLEDRIRLILQQRNEYELVLSGMTEGVIAVDQERRIINLNQAAAKLLGINAVEARERKLEETVLNPGFQNLVSQVLSKQEAAEGDIIFQENSERVFHVHGDILINGEGNSTGALMVLNDVTRIRRLETVRRDFVANVSHELKTPLTSIKGFVETLLDGAMNNPEENARFLKIVAKQVNRLHAILEDLLSLSKIEQEEQHGEILLTVGSIRETVRNAIQTCEMQASEKNIQIEFVDKNQVYARMNAHLLEQAMVNLLDNAIKYSDPGKKIRVETTFCGTDIGIHVRDEGCGIPARHLPRLFERFYRVDKARSRRLGGTGLGLAIVKHIVQAHKGRVKVESEAGKGSTFSIFLPLVKG